MGSLMLRLTQLLASNKMKLLCRFRDFRGAEEFEAAVWEGGRCCRRGREIIHILFYLFIMAYESTVSRPPLLTHPISNNRHPTVEKTGRE